MRKYGFIVLIIPVLSFAKTMNSPKCSKEFETLLKQPVAVINPHAPEHYRLAAMMKSRAQSIFSDDLSKNKLNVMRFSKKEGLYYSKYASSKGDILIFYESTSHIVAYRINRNKKNEYHCFAGLE